MSNQLLPCPFCGSRNIHMFVGVKAYEITCRGCDIKGPIYDNQDSAVSSWNRRATQPAAGEPGSSDFPVAIQARFPGGAWSIYNLGDAVKLNSAGMEVRGLYPATPAAAHGASEEHRNQMADTIVSLRTEIAALRRNAAAHGDGLHFSTTEDLASAIRQVSAYEDLGPELIAEEIFKRAGAIDAAHGDEAVRARLCEAYESGYQDGQKWPDSYSIQADKDKVADALIAAMRAQAGEGDKV